VFVQADATLPFYKATSQNYSNLNYIPSNPRNLPSLVFSVGLGWQKNHRGLQRTATSIDFFHLPQLTVTFLIKVH
jgi:hypothetical protein